MDSEPVNEPIIAHDNLDAFAARAVNLPREVAQGHRDQVNTLRERLERHIDENPGFSLVKMLHAGSVAKGTALRTVNDLDLDVAVYVRKDDAPSGEAELVDWMAERLREAYGKLINPDQIQPGTHCVTITFVGSGLSVDVVPVLYEGDADDRGYLIAKDTGDRLLTSVRLHLRFIRARKNAHPDDYAQVVRFMKWWARQRKLADPAFKFKSFMVELLVAYLADQGVDLTNHPQALEDVFGYIVKTGLAERIAFTDFYSAAMLLGPTGAAIEIFDPVNPSNNVAYRYSTVERDRIVEAADEALGAITEARYATTKAQAVACWQVVLGPSFRG
jgi:tRNA nucleotidyltransferase (CCA-adding enzyme)